MAAEIIKVYKQDMPASRFIGKKYSDKDRVNGMFGKYWGDWYQNGWFDIIAKQTDKDLKSLYEDGDAHIGLMRHKNGEFEYWIGIFMPENTPAPDGYDYCDFPKASLGVCWVYGEQSEVFLNEKLCGVKLEEQGYKMMDGTEETICCFERYVCPRFTTPDEKGKIILDICFFLKEKA